MFVWKIGRRLTCVRYHRMQWGISSRQSLLQTILTVHIVEGCWSCTVFEIQICPVLSPSPTSMVPPLSIYIFAAICSITSSHAPLFAMLYFYPHLGLGLLLVFYYGMDCSDLFYVVGLRRLKLTNRTLHDFIAGYLFRSSTSCPLCFS